jgi:protein SCO1/2
MAPPPSPPRSTLKQFRIIAWVLVALAVAGVAALVLMRSGPVEAPQPAAAKTEPNIGGPFTLVGADGKPFSSTALKGKPYALFFGFTHCGDVCPTTLARLVKLRQQAGGDQAFQIVFVTTDPERDTPPVVGQYATLFNAPIIGLTGSVDQIEAVKKSYGIYAQKHPMPGGGKMDYMMDHTATVLLYGRDGRFAGTIAPDEPDSSALEKLKLIVT